MAEEYVKISVEDELPTVEGKYIVFTKTGFGNQNVFECAMHIKKGQVHWICHNQIVKYWLKLKV